MNNRILKRKSTNPANAIQILAKNGIEVNEKQAELILDFLKIFLKSAIMQYFKEDIADSMQNIEPLIENQTPVNKLEEYLTSVRHIGMAYKMPATCNRHVSWSSLNLTNGILTQIFL